MNFDALILALLGGILPALVWLLFWLREDRKNPEPNRLVMKTFLLGMLAVIVVIPLQKQVEDFFPGLIALQLLLWAALEEVLKFSAGYFGGIHTVDDNEPIDPLIYMVTAALGFVALENTLFILGPLLGDNIPQGVITGNLRFVGASLLHVITSGLVGYTLSFSFYQSRGRKKKMVTLGILGAILIHTTFNLLILGWGEKGMMTAFFGVWIAVIALLWLFERAKGIARNV